MSVFQVRTARDADSPHVIALVDAAYKEYPNCVLDVDAEEPELRAVASRFHAKGGEFWVAEPTRAHAGCPTLHGARLSRSWPVLGSSAVWPSVGREGSWELKKMYVMRELRRTGVASALLRVAESWLIQRGARELVLWSDSRFTEAHSFYRARDFERQPGERQLHDLSDTTEYPFVKQLG